jgi:predicted acetyltransferase
MSELEIREIFGEAQQDILYRLTSYAFRSTPPLPDEEAFKNLSRLRQAMLLAAFSGDETLACVAARGLTHNVRGKTYPAAGIFGVAVEPGARRQGLARRLLSDLLARQRAQGAVFSCLYPFRESFYERLGYVSFPLQHWIRFDTAPLTPLLKKDLGGSVQRYLLRDHVAEYMQLRKAFVKTRHGVAIFAVDDLGQGQRNNRWLAVARVDGQIVGGMAYEMVLDPPKSVMRVHRFMPLTVQGRYLLLEWMARHVDQTPAAELWLPPAETPETWMPDLTVSSENAFLIPMGRVLDVARLDGLPAADGRFCVQVQDDICPWNTGVWTFTASQGELRVTPGGEPQAVLPIQGLSALVYGVKRAEELTYRGWGSPDPGLAAQMDAIFSAQLPYMFELF